MSSLTLAFRPLEFFLTQYRRMWRGNVVTSVVSPVVYLLALGVGLGVFVDRSANLPNGVSYLEFVAPGRESVYAEFHVDDALLEEIRSATAGGAKYLRWCETSVCTADGEVVARVRKQIYVRRKAGT